ncbi:Hypothetical_protein [Hexamita inflata]|uniref:Hypothetical_protein n=1 Tax=Hexamita inflata TaxID=28002 RepID=A0AA86P7I2_9EUKA|nr:Hypothetical protein HINF_LOCUS19871 [Hexamita inflata]
MQQIEEMKAQWDLEKLTRSQLKEKEKLQKTQEADLLRSMTEESRFKSLEQERIRREQQLKDLIMQTEELNALQKMKNERRQSEQQQEKEELQKYLQSSVNTQTKIKMEIDQQALEEENINRQLYEMLDKVQQLEALTQRVGKQ